ncbi:MAG: 30S ribosomal protein S16 [Bacteroidetes bacterium]|nr:30S ribosomal protein S16 [Bacteroidota bacterium]
MIKIRLQRKGRIRRPIYHIVVADSRSPRDGRIIEQVGRFDGVTEKKETVLNEARIAYWLDNGAKPTDAVQKILRNEGFLYKRHLQMWGKSEAEIEATLAEWSANRASKKETETTRKEQVRASLLAEEKEVKKQTQQKASEAAAEMAQEAAAEVEVASEETTDSVTEEAVEEVATETAGEAPAEEAVEEETSEVAVEETTETTEEVSTEEVNEEVPAEEESADAVSEEASEEVAAETTEETPVEASEETTEGSTNSSKDMTAKDAVDHIAAHTVEELSGFVSDDEDRKTVLAAWEAKKEA